MQYDKIKKLDYKTTDTYHREVSIPVVLPTDFDCENLRVENNNNLDQIPKNILRKNITIQGYEGSFTFNYSRGGCKVNLTDQVVTFNTELNYNEGIQLLFAVLTNQQADRDENILDDALDHTYIIFNKKRVIGTVTLIEGGSYCFQIDFENNIAFDFFERRAFTSGMSYINYCYEVDKLNNLLSLSRALNYYVEDLIY